MSGYGTDFYDSRSPELEAFLQQGIPATAGYYNVAQEESNASLMERYRKWNALRFPMNCTHGFMIEIIGLDVTTSGGSGKNNQLSRFFSDVVGAGGGELKMVGNEIGTAVKTLGITSAGQKSISGFSEDTSKALKGVSDCISTSSGGKAVGTGVNAVAVAGTNIATQSIAGQQLFPVINAVVTATPKTIRRLILPLPNDIKVTYDANWNGQSVLPIAYALRNYINQDEESKANAVRNLVGAVEVGAIKALVGGLGDSANLAKAAALSAGVAFNPYRQLMYDAPSFRTFTFSWILSPKNGKESADLNEIIWYLKKHMHPSTLNNADAEGQMFWMNPDYINCTFLLDSTNQTPNQWLPLIKKSAITTVSVNYESKFHGVTETNPAGASGAISLTISILETVILTQNDFKSPTSQNP